MILSGSRDDQATDFLQDYAENAQAMASERNRRHVAKELLYDPSISLEQQLHQPNITQPATEAILAPVACWLERAEPQAGPVSYSEAFFGQSEVTQGMRSQSVQQPLQPDGVDRTDDWVLAVPDYDLSDGFLFQSPVLDNALESSRIFQKPEAYTTHDDGEKAVQPAALSVSYTNDHQQPKDKSSGAFPQLKRLRIPRVFGKSSKGPLPPGSQIMNRASRPAQQPSSPGSAQASSMESGPLPNESVPSLKRSRRTGSTSSHSPVSKKACGSLERANSLNKLRDLESKLYAAEGERDKLMNFVREFRQEVEKWEVEDDSSGEVQNLIDVFNMRLKKVRHLL